MTITIATWNINSIRIRLHLLQQLITSTRPDIICLQEIKTAVETFPFEAVKALGYEHIYVNGQKGYHGVATLSKKPLAHLDSLSLLPDGGARHISVGLPDGTELHNFYVPAGGDIPDRVLNPYYGFKLDYIDAMRTWFIKNKKSANKLILVGDLNVAPLEHDVWSHKQLLKIVSHTPDEVERLTQLYGDFGWQDAARHFTPPEEKLYSWWSYRNRDWKVANRGRRLDHVWLTKPLLTGLKSCDTLIDARDWEKPSDHVPIVITLK